MQLVKPLKLGKLELSTNLIQAPLAGVSAAPFRELIHHFGGVGYCCTEMISAKTLIHKPPKRYITTSNQEGLVCFQLSGNIPEELAQASEVAVQYGADLIDLNAGCPVDKIRKKGCGSKLLAESAHLGKLIHAIQSVSTIPVSVKIRVDGKSGDRFNTEVVQAVTEAGADFLIVHGRHWTEHYETSVQLDEIATIVSVAKIPVIGNGDIKDYASLKKMFDATGCHGVMIGRGSVGKPWLFQELQQYDQGQTFTSPDAAKIGQLFLKHVEGLVGLEGEYLAILQARKLSKYYLRAAQLDEDLLKNFYNLTKLIDLKNLIIHLFRAHY